MSASVVMNDGPSDLNDPMEWTPMRRGPRQILARALPLVAVLGLLVATSGCGGGDGAKKPEAASGIPKNVDESNKNMQDFMNNQKAKK
jgi:hypothetical protein